MTVTSEGTETTYRAGVFDLDGVVTNSARLHFAAWKELFDGLLRERAARGAGAFEEFGEEDYLRYVDGKPRQDGLRAFLAARGIELPEGDPDDPPERQSVWGLGKRKNEIFQRRLRRDGVEVFDGSVAFIRRVRELGMKTALVSSSRNTDAVLETTGLGELFDERVGGVEAARLGLAGKPAPDTFLYALERLGVAPAHAFGVEDALSGVAALRAAGYGLVVGMDRVGQAEALRRHGADVVVRELTALPLTEPLADGLENFAALKARLQGKRLAVFLDYDGTLTPIVDRPELAVLDADMRSVIRELAARCSVAIISGRDRADVERLVDVEGLVYAGSHGFDIAGPGGLAMQYPGAAEFLPDLDRAEAALRARLEGIEGALIERKRYAIAVHYRLVSAERLAEVEAAVDATLAEASDRLRRTGGKKVYELRVRLPWDKGGAVAWLLDGLGLNGPDVLPLYLGDDETDEDAFAMLCERGGVGVLVAPQPQRTLAHYRLDDPDAVGRFLRALLEVVTR